MNQQKLRLGLALDSFQIPAWVYESIQRTINDGHGEFVLVVLNADAGISFRQAKRSSVYSIFNRIDERLFGRQPNPFTHKDARAALADIPVIEAQTEGGRSLREMDMVAIRQFQLDVLVKFGFDGLQLDAATYGTWETYLGDDRIERTGPPGFWESTEHWPETTSALIASGGKFSTRRVLFRSHFVTYPLSPARHRSYYVWAAVPFLARQVKALHEMGEEKFVSEIEKFDAGSPPKVKENDAPSNLAAMRAIGKLGLRLVGESVRRIFTDDQWMLLFSLENDVSDGLAKFIKMQPPRGKFWADPHALRVGNDYFIFIEEFSEAKNKGYISVIEMDALGNWKPPVTVLEKDYHLSYPFVFEWDGKIYMVPESRANRTIDLYECVEFPHRWSFKQSLMKNISAVDTTLVRHAGQWWMFTALAEVEAAAPNVELFLFHADDLFSGEWTPHPRNPIISDVKRARPAGSFFLRDGKLFRPSQDCSHAYGYGFDLNEVETLSETDYREKRVISIRPDWDRNILGAHTYAHSGNLTVIDTLRRISRVG
jgi:hypothetical protein